MDANSLTACINCGTVLTTIDGHRLASANFDSRFPSIKNEYVIWARCDRCIAVARLIAAAYERVP